MINRDVYLNRIVSKMHSSRIKIITGVRRCGKSYLLKNIFVSYLKEKGIHDNQIILVELDDDKYEQLRNKKNLREYIENKANEEKQYYIIIDEVQLVNEFEGTIISLNNHPNYDVYITGSNSKFLSKDIFTGFKDRGTEIRIHPLSYKEFYDNYNGDRHFALSEYLMYGGMPYIAEETDENEKMNYLQSLVSSTYLIDVVERNHVKLPEKLSSVFDMLCSSTGSLISPKSIAGTLMADKHIKIDNETVFSYIQYFEDAFLFEKSRRFNIKGKAYLNSPAKYYPEDVGLRNARINFRQNDLGFAIENVIYNELRIRGYMVDVGMLETRERNTSGKQVYKQKEVDFIARLGSKEYYIQVMNRIPDGIHGENEYDSLRKVPGSFRKVAVINEVFKSYTNDDGILMISLEEFLLNKDSLNL